jgi:hypothetical protein
MARRATAGGGNCSSLVKNRCPGMVHGGAHQHFGGFQFQMSRLQAAVENHTQQLDYFARDLLLEGFGRFFLMEESYPQQVAPDRSSRSPPVTPG